MATKRFLTPLDQICRKGMTDVFSYIYFKDKYIYASNGVVSIKQRMELHGLTPLDMETLDGFAIHKDVFRFVNRQKNVEFKHLMFIIDVPNSNQVMAEFKVAGSRFTCSIPSIKEIIGKGLILKQIDKMFSGFESVCTREVALNPDSITLLRKVFVTKSSGFTFRFNEGTGGVLVTPNKSNYKEHAMIVPLIITGEYAKGI